MTEPPVYTPFNITSLQKQTDIQFKKNMQIIYNQINESIQDAVNNGLYKCKIFIDFKSTDRDHIIHIIKSIKENYKNFNSIKVKENSPYIYKVKIKW